MLVFSSKKLFSALIALAFIANTTLSFAQTASPAAPASKASVSIDNSAEAAWPAWVKLGGKAGDSRDLGTLNFFVPLAQSQSDLWFADLRGKDASGAESEWNAGGGYRRLMSDESWILGVYGFYDHLRSANRNYFSQGSVGVEALTTNWDLRANAYFPETTKHFLGTVADYSSSSVVVSGTSIGVSYLSSEVREQAMPGFDAEVGFRVPAIDPDIRLYAGGFYFDRSGLPEIAGPRGRAEFRIEDPFGCAGTRITLDSEYTYDRVRESEWFVGASVRIPLDLSFKKVRMHNKNSLKARMTETIVRDIDIVSAPTASTPTQQIQPAINPATGQPYTGIYFAEEGGTGVGTQEDPTNLGNAITLAGENGIIAALDSEGTIDVDGNNFVLQQGQMLIGSGGTVQIFLPGDNVATFNIAGTATTITDGDPGDFTIGVTGNNTISNVILDGGNVGIYGEVEGSVRIVNTTVTNMDNNGVELYGDNISSVVITDSHFDENGGTGLYIEDFGDVYIDPSSASNNDGRGIDIQDISGNVDLLDVTADSNSNRNINIESVAGNVVLDNVSGDESQNARGVAINDITGNVTIENSNFDNNQGTNISIANDSSITGDVTILNTTANGSADRRGIDIGDSGIEGDVTLEDVTADENNDTNLEISNVTGDVSIDSSSFSGSIDSHGVEIFSVEGDIALTDVTANENDETNLYIDQDGNAGNVSIDASTFNNGDSYGLEIYNVVGNTTITNVTANDNDNNNLYIYQNGYEGNLTIQSSNFNRSADGYGLEIYYVNGNITLTSVTADDNYDNNLYIDQDGYEGNLTIESSNFNRSEDDYGMEIYYVNGNTTLSNVTANDNYNTNLYIDQDGYDGNLTIQSSNFNRSYDGNGLEIYYVEGNTIITNVTADDNAFDNLYIDQNGYEGNLTIQSSNFNRSSNGIGLSIYNVLGDTTITSVIANDNNGSNLYIDQDGYEGNVLVNSSSSFDGSIDSRGVDIQNVDGNVTLQDVTADDNDERNINIEDVSGDVLLDNVSGDDSVSARGVAINDIGGNVTIEDSNFDSNQGTNINIGNDDTITGSVTIRNTTANASQNFRGIDINDVGLDVTLENVTADGNDETNLEITDVDGDIYIDLSSFDNSENGDGVYVDSGDSFISISNSTAVGNDDTDLDFSSYDDYELTNVTYNTYNF